MSKSLTVNGITYNYPSPGENPGWGEDATEWAEEVTVVLNELNPDGSITQTEDNLVDNQSTVANVSGLSFDSSSVKSALVEYNIERSTVTEMGFLYITYNSGDWTISRQSQNGDAGVDFDVTSSGQVQYRTTSTGNSAVLKFRAKTILNQ